jgi:hypothetical protein
MRPSTIDLTMNVYTDPKLLDVAGAVESRATEAVAVSACVVKRKDPLTTAVNESSGVERRRVELPTSALRTQRSPN